MKPLKCPSSVSTQFKHTMITSLTPFSSVVAGFPQFIEETNADWDMATDYILSQVSALTYSEWAIVEKIYDETIGGMSN